MGSKRSNTASGTSGSASAASRLWVDLLYAIPLIIGIGMITYSLTRPHSAAPPVPTVAAAPVTPPAASRDALLGKWRRQDGDYMLEIRSIATDGTAETRYYNPNPVHVATAKAAASQAGVGIFVLLQDEGYRGSNYTLSYDPGHDALTGIYRQPEVRQEYQIVFERIR